MKKFETPIIEVYGLSDIDVMTTSSIEPLVDPLTSDPETPIIVVD